VTDKPRGPDLRNIGRRRTISDALRDEELSRELGRGEMRKRDIVPRDPSARPIGSEGGYQRIPVRYE
jgi:hypothetical protein